MRFNFPSGLNLHCDYVLIKAQFLRIFRAKIVDVQPKSLTIEVTGDESKIEKFLTLMKTFGIIDLTRTGKVALPRKADSK